MSRGATIGWGLLIALGVGLILLGLLVIKPSAPSGWVEEDGTVVGHVFVQGNNQFEPIVEYTGPSGDKHRFRPDDLSNPPPSNGSSYHIAYNPDNPSEAKSLGGASRWLWWFTGLFGVAAIAGAAFGIRSARHGSDASPFRV
jgi:Protein of unknown function (DUF3592)